MRGRLRAGTMALVCSFLGLTASAHAQNRFHSLLLKPLETPVKADLLIVGIEKDHSSATGIANDLENGAACAIGGPCLQLKDNPKRDRAYVIRGRLHDNPLVITHVADLTATGCAIVYSGYEGRSTGDACAGGGPLRLKPGGAEASWAVAETVVHDAVRARLKARCASGPCPTHVILMSTGWNNPELKGVEKYRKWMDHISADFARRGQPQPVFVGIAWPSDWKIPYASVFNKANDADEIGYTWAGVIVHRAFAALREETGVNVAMIGHSYGARMLSTAVAARPFLTSACARPSSRDNVLKVVGFQAAFSTSRFPRRGWEHSPYLDAQECGNVFAYTNSENDGAVSVALTQWTSPDTGYIGGPKGYRKAALDPAVYVLTRSDEHGRITPPIVNPGKVLLIEASIGIGCHNDVYSEYAGHLFGQVISGVAAGDDHLSPHVICGIGGDPPAESETH